MDWTEGYVHGLDYTHGYFRELSPGLLDLACVLRGVSTLLEYRPLTYLELAFGQGVSASIHAAACEGDFWGIDFNPAHAINARELAAASGSGAQFSDESLEEFAARDDLPEFDAIALHGTWSWISDRNRAIVVDIVRRKLAAGGVFYVSYNCTAGWAQEMPIRHLMAMHAEIASPPGTDLGTRIRSSIRFARSLMDSGGGYFRANPSIKAWLDHLSAMPSNYLAHEYFNRDWAPMASSDVARALAEAKLTYVASANLTDQFEGFGLPQAAADLMTGIADTALRETVSDLMANQRFRRDIFVKGPRTMAPTVRTERLRSIPFSLLQAPKDVPMKTTTNGREVTLHPDVYGPLLEAMAADRFAPKTLAQIEAHPACGKIAPDRLSTGVALLVGMGSAHTAQGTAAADSVAARCKTLNELLIERAVTSDSVSALASPVLGAGVTVGRPEMLYLRAIAMGRKSPDEWGDHAWQCLKANSQKLMVKGRALETDAENIEHLRSTARVFAGSRLPALSALRLA